VRYLWTTLIFSIALKRIDKKAQFKNKAAWKENKITASKKSIAIKVFI